MWTWLARPLFFLLDAERAHHLAMRLLTLLTLLPGGRWLVARMGGKPSPILSTTSMGISFRSPIGLAAGFDKDARHIHNLALLGFTAIEVGTLTAHPQPGNPRPRLFRLPKDRALLNRFGFNNGGSADAVPRLAQAPNHVVLGVNIGKSKVTPNEEAVDDYLTSLDRIWPHAHYIVVNVSSPNTAGLRDLQAREPLDQLLGALSRRNRALAEQAGEPPRPLLVKIAPDLEDEALRDIAGLVRDHGLNGVIATNTTLSREGLVTNPAVVESLGAGGISGAPLTQRSREVVSFLYRELGGSVPIVGVGGILSGEDAWELARAGASLLQVYSGFVYGGPHFVRTLHADLAARMVASGFERWEDVVGSAHRETETTPSDTLEPAS